MDLYKCIIYLTTRHTNQFSIFLPFLTLSIQQFFFHCFILQSSKHDLIKSAFSYFKHNSNQGRSQWLAIAQRHWIQTKAPWTPRNGTDSNNVPKILFSLFYVINRYDNVTSKFRQCVRLAEVLRSFMYVLLTYFLKFLLSHAQSYHHLYPYLRIHPRLHFHVLGFFHRKMFEDPLPQQH